MYSNHMLPEHVDCKHVTYGLAVTLTSRAVFTALCGMFVMTTELQDVLLNGHVD